MDACRRLAECYDSDLGRIDDPTGERSFAAEASRLLRQLDRWRCGLLGLARHGEGQPELAARVDRLRQEVEEGPAGAVLERSELFVDAAPLAEVLLGAVRGDLEEVDEDLAGTLDVFAAVAVGGCQEALSTGIPEAAPARTRRLRLLPRPLPAAAAAGDTPKTVHLVWEAPDGLARARMAFAPARHEEEQGEEAVLEVRPFHGGSPPAGTAVLFGIARALQDGAGRYGKAELRRAELHWAGPTLEIVDGESGNRLRYRLVQPVLEDVEE
jgi:hypothetical protein